MLSWLYVPGDRPDRFSKAVGAGADVVILDLEDAVAPTRKAYARDAVADFLGDVPAVPCEVRVNGPADLGAVVGRPGLSGVRVPKVEDPAALADYQSTGVPVHVLIETALGVERAYEIAASGVASVTLGEADLGSDLGVTAEEGFDWARGRLVIAARAAGLPSPAMSVWTDLRDLDGLAASCRRGRNQGLVGRAAIHPAQVPVIVDAFRPSAADAGRARDILAAFEKAAVAGSGTAVLADGRFADRAMIGAAQRVAELADRYGVSSPAASGRRRAIRGCSA